jgi:hypothetical protein
MSESEINAAWDDGFHCGFEQGETSAYDRGYEHGYHKGIQEKAISTQGYDDGYNDGYAEGKHKGYEEGYETGWDYRYQTGKSEVSEKDTQISDDSFPKHLKTDKQFLKKLQESAEECLVRIDFERIHSVMKHLDWKWGLGEGAEVPSIAEIVISAQRYLNAAVKGFLENTCNEYYVYSGGLKASVYGSEDGFCKVTLEFIVSDCESTIGEEE